MTLTTALTETERLHFRDQGYLGPMTLMSPSDMAPIRQQLVDNVLYDEKVHWGEHNRHLDSKLVYDLATQPEILNRMASILGENLLLWRTNFFVKEEGAREIPWHQDGNYWPLEPAVVVSAWIAIDDSTIDNSCLQIIPGTHKKVLPHIKATEDQAFAEQIEPAALDTSQAIDLEMKAGEFILFNERLCHHSHPFKPGASRRIALAVRVIPPLVNVLSADSEHHKMMIIRGEDPLGFNAVCDPPTP